MSLMGAGEEANGNTDPHGLDPADPDISLMAGLMMNMDADLKELRVEIRDQGGTLDKIAKVLGIEPTRTLPPPIREELKSLHEADDSLRRTDADVSTKIEAVSTQAAEALIKTSENKQEVTALRTLVKDVLIEHLAKIGKSVGIGAAALAALAALLAQVWSAFHGR